MRRSHELRREVDEPRWVTDREAGADEPLSLYARTYAGIGREERERRGRGHRRRRLLVVLGIAILAAAVVAAPWLLPRLPLPPPRAPTTSVPAAGETPAARGPDVIGTAPARPKTTLHVGDAGDFAVVANGTDVHYGWTVDGRPAASGPRFVYSPASGDVGRHRIEVTVTSREGTALRTWTARVLPPRPPRILAAEPASAALDVVAGSPLRLRVTPTAPAGQSAKTTWTFGDEPAGAGNDVTLHPSRPGAFTVRALVSTGLGATAERTWHVNVKAPPPSPPPAATPAPATPAATPKEETPAPAPAPVVEAAREPRRGPARPARERHGPSDDVRRWLERYAAAWRAHDVDALRRMGQVTTAAEVDALRRYFSNTQDLDVEVNLLALRTEGDRTVVRFTRRDRFRDPAGRLLLRESPPIQKELVRTSDGFRIVREPG
ncbi:MAG TPA: PKD domain-containing protein [Candidatus Binatia bacterium]|nr:PKD domain-containing protein [Candidatus Binatia bacterium]